MGASRNSSMSAAEPMSAAEKGNNTLKWISLSLLLLQNALNPLIFRYATTEVAGGEKFSTPVAVLVQEFLKFVLSFVLYFWEVGFSIPALVNGIQADCLEQPVATAKLGVPAFVYFLQNMSLQFSSANLPAAVFQVLYNGKTLVVAMFSVSMLNKTLTKAKWLALALMGAGLAMVQLGAGEETAQKDMGNSSEQSIALGLAFVLFGCMCSGFAGVYFEKMMKPQANPDGSMPRNPSMWMKNMQLSFFTLLIGLVQVFVLVPVDMSKGALNGFTPKVWVMVWNNALGGLLVAMVIKYADNILKGFACALATVVAAILSVPLFGFQIGIAFMIGTGIVVYSTLLYGGTVKVPAAAGDPQKWNEEFEVCSVFKSKKQIISPEKEMMGP